MSTLTETDEQREARQAKQRASYDVQREATRAKVLAAAVACAKVDGYQWITRKAVAARAGVASGVINFYFGNMVELKRAVLRWAAANGDAQLIAEGLAAGSPAVADISQDLRNQAAAIIATA